MRNYEESWEEFRNDELGYWAKKMECFTWFTPWKRILDNEDPYSPKWFVGGKMNLCYDCLDRKVKEGHGNKTAVIFDSTVTHRVTRYTYNELLNKVSKLSRVFMDNGVNVGDIVLLYMPTIIETLISIFAVTRIGATFTVLNGDYSDEAIAARLDELKANVAVVCNGEVKNDVVVQTKYKLDRAIELAQHKIKTCVVLQRPQLPLVSLKEGKDIEFNEAISKADHQECIPVEANSNAFLLYTSGTTGKPKGIVQSVRGLAIGVSQVGEEFFGVGCKVSYVGCNYAWITGLMYNCFMPLLLNTTAIIYEDTSIVPDVKELYRILAEHEIETYFAPTCLWRMYKQQDPFGNVAKSYGPFKLKKIYSGAVPGDLLTLEWIASIFNLLAPQIYGCTETGGLVTIPNLSRGRSLRDTPILSSLHPLPGLNVRILREDGTEAACGEIGEIVLKEPYSPTIASTVLLNHDLFVKSFFKAFPGYFDTKDYGKLDKDGCLYVYSRSDDVFKAGGGNKISCGAIEEVILMLEDVLECVVVTKMGDDHGTEIHIPVPFVILKKDAKLPAEDVSKLVAEVVHRDLGNFIPIARPVILESLPRTLSGKIQRGIVKKLCGYEIAMLLKVNEPDLQPLVSALLQVNQV